MKQTPILFSTPMVQAILEGRKTQTRRVVKYNKKIDNPVIGWTVFSEKGDFSVRGIHENGEYGESFFKQPYTKGDILWVREEHYRFGRWIKNGTTKTGRQKWKFEALDNEVRYNGAMRVAFLNSRTKSNPSSPYWYKRLARFMPKTAVRIWLEIVLVRTERLQSIKGLDAKSEGIELVPEGYKNYLKKPGLDLPNNWPTAYHSFQSLWESINGSESWDANPWVWVIEFKMIEKPEGI